MLEIAGMPGGFNIQTFLNFGHIFSQPGEGYGWGEVLALCWKLVTKIFRSTPGRSTNRYKLFFFTIFLIQRYHSGSCDRADYVWHFNFLSAVQCHGAHTKCNVLIEVWTIYKRKEMVQFTLIDAHSMGNSFFRN